MRPRGPSSSSSISTWVRAPADELLDELRGDGIPVVVVSGTVDVTEYEGRASAVMPKPFDPADLIAAAHRHTVG